MHASDSRHVSVCVCVLLAKYEIRYYVQSLGIIYNAKNPRQSIKKIILYFLGSLWEFFHNLPLGLFLAVLDMEHGAYYLCAKENALQSQMPF